MIFKERRVSFPEMGRALREMASPYPVLGQVIFTLPSRR